MKIYYGVQNSLKFYLFCYKQFYNYYIQRI